MPIEIQVLRKKSDVDAIETRWNELAGDNPFLRWEWLGSWWEAYRGSKPTKQLFVLALREHDQYIGFAPWFIEERPYQGKTICFLGSGKVCSDHLTLLCHPSDASLTAKCVADWLIDASQSKSDDKDWNHIELIGVDADDAAIAELHKTFLAASFQSGCRPGTPCYGITLPATLDEYVKRRSKSGRHECRKIRKWIDAGEFDFFVPRDVNELEPLWFPFVDLHQSRRHAVGDVGCFDYPHFSAFLWNASNRLLRSDLLHFTMVYRQGEPIAAQYALQTERAFYCYQSGMNVAARKFKPGQVVLCQTIQHSIAEGKQYFDLLRGNEQYKRRWRATPQATIELRVASRRVTAKLQHTLWRAGATLSDWALNASTNQPS